MIRRRLAILTLAVLAGCAPASPAPSSALPVATPPASASASSPAMASPAPSVAHVPSASSAVASPPAAATPTPSPTSSFTLTSSAFRASGAIPRRFACDGADVSPAMAWTGVPTGTGRLVLLVEDPDAGNFAHWIAFSMPATATGLAQGAGAAGSDLVQGTNDFGRVGYGGPCPPSGTHHYRFTLYAIADPLGLDGNPRASAVRAALARADVLGEATLTATYRRGG